jgi:ATP-binding protein involved in chromosome partitioning
MSNLLRGDAGLAQARRPHGALSGHSISLSIDYLPRVQSDSGGDTAVIAVTSGKGGVGKSTVSLNLALALAERTRNVGLLDADVYGPDIPLMVNLKRSVPMRRWMLARSHTRGALELEPVERFGIKIMSVGFLLAESQALALPAPLLQGALHQLLRDVRWGPLDVLVIDLPPGTADLQQELLRLAPITGALIVVGPQDVAHLDGRKVLDLLRTAGVPVLGAVENMTALVCPHCGKQVDVFPQAVIERSLWADGVPRLASIPLDPAIALAGDRGRPVLVAESSNGQATAFRELAGRVLEALARSG